MASRSGKRKYRENPPMPIWIPLPRPCIRSMNMPGPYYIPVPEMCMQWLPPPYFPKPVCHCTNENFCTTSNCKNSTECHKIHPDFCPHGPKNDGLDIQQNHKHNVENSDEQVSSTSDIDICTSCGASFGNKKICEYTKQNQHQNQNNSSDRTPSYTFKDHTYVDSASSPYISKGQRKEVLNSSPLSGSMATKIDKNVSKSVLVNEDNAKILESTQAPAYPCTNSSCQTPAQLGESSVLPTQAKNSAPLMTKSVDAPQRTSTSISSATSCSPEVDNSVHRLPPLNTESSQRNLARNSYGCTNCSAVKRNDSGSINSSSNTEYRVLSEKPSVNITCDKIHIEQLPDHLSHARSQRTCYSDLPKSYQIGPAINAATTDKTLKKSSKNRTVSECGCTSTKIHIDKAKQTRKSLSNIHKASECECSLTEITGNMSGSKFNKSESNTRQVSKREYPSTKKFEITENKSRNYLSKIKSSPKCSCSVTKLPTRKSSSKIINREPSSPKHDTKMSSVKTPSATNMIPLRDANLKPSSCQCKFPPAYSHLSRSSNPSGNCNCSRDPLQKSDE